MPPKKGIGCGKVPEKGDTMDQLHKRFTAEQVKVLLQGYSQSL
jgi:hypothetical protein